MHESHLLRLFEDEYLKAVKAFPKVFSQSHVQKIFVQRSLKKDVSAMTQSRRHGEFWWA